MTQQGEAKCRYRTSRAEHWNPIFEIQGTVITVHFSEEGNATNIPLLPCLLSNPHKNCTWPLRVDGDSQLHTLDTPKNMLPKKYGSNSSKKFLGQLLRKVTRNASTCGQKWWSTCVHTIFYLSITYLNLKEIWKTHISHIKAINSCAPTILSKQTEWSK